MDTTFLIQVEVTIPDTHEMPEAELEARKRWIANDIELGLAGLDCSTVRVSAVEATLVPYRAKYTPESPAQNEVSVNNTKGK